jgi:FkbM family methyltransferase
LKISINHVAFEVNHSFRSQYWEAIDSGNWETGTFNVIDYFLNDSNVALDLGCWAGPLTLYMAGKGATVYAVDPDPEAFDALEVNVGLNPNLSGTIHTHKLAIGANNSQMPLHARSGYGNSSTSLLNRTRDKVFNSLTEVVSFLNFLERNKITRLDFIKIDVEGGEFQFLGQVEELLNRFEYPTILLSLHYSHLNESIHQSKIGMRWVSLVIMKLEQYTGFILFRKALEVESRKVVSLGSRYKFVYDINGQKVTSEELTANFLMKKYSDLVFSNQEWTEHSSINYGT